MNEVDDVVRTMLADRAGTVPEPTHLLDGVHRKIRRRRNHRRALVSAAAVLALIGVGSVAWGVERQDREDRLVPADRPSTSPTTNTPSPSADGDRKLVAGNPPVAPAPLRPGTLPPGFPAAQLSLDTKNSWVYTTVRPEAPGTGLMIRISRTLLGPSKGPGSTRSIPIRSAAATLYTVSPEQMARKRPYDAGTYYNAAYAEITFRHPSGVWVQVTAGVDGDGIDKTPLDVSEAQLAAVAYGLTEAPTTVPDLLRFATVPDGLVVGAVWAGLRGDAAEVQFVSPRAGQRTTNPKANSHTSGGADIPLTVRAGGPDDIGISTIQRVYPQWRTIRTGNTVITVGRSANKNGNTVFTAPLGANRVVVVQVFDRLALSDENMARFITGITPGTDLP